ncbi:hypothetical protein BZJ19_06240 [Salinivibrio proteolyticus]|uniref:STAS domain-containing protein n=1 Tax=Salinivibrio proteolyticus TaxID=334715 RepID=UPI000988FE1F|nr:STAS domain-containing protein [Salinivibrio proteolyticus]OOF26131.1 hypothetical protein BZJ19_06240 [Salinivibrio proteolyticus]
MDITLGESLDITQIQSIKEEIANKIGDEKQCILDAGSVNRIDGAGLQLLLCLVRTQEQLQWQNVSESLYGAAQTAGMVELLKLNR